MCSLNGRFQMFGQCSGGTATDPSIWCFRVFRVIYTNSLACGRSTVLLENTFFFPLFSWPLTEFSFILLAKKVPISLKRLPIRSIHPLQRWRWVKEKGMGATNWCFVIDLIRLGVSSTTIVCLRYCEVCPLNSVLRIVLLLSVADSLLIASRLCWRLFEEAGEICRLLRLIGQRKRGRFTNLVMSLYCCWS